MQNFINSVNDFFKYLYIEFRVIPVMYLMGEDKTIRTLALTYGIMLFAQLCLILFIFDLTATIIMLSVTLGMYIYYWYNCDSFIRISKRTFQYVCDKCIFTRKDGSKETIHFVKYTKDTYLPGSRLGDIPNLKHQMLQLYNKLSEHEEALRLNKHAYNTINRRGMYKKYLTIRHSTDEKGALDSFECAYLAVNSIGKIVGICHVHDYSKTHSAKQAYLWGMYVETGYRGPNTDLEGSIADIILQKIKYDYRDKGLFLIRNADNDVANNLYMTNLFKTMGKTYISITGIATVAESEPNYLVPVKYSLDPVTVTNSETNEPEVVNVIHVEKSENYPDSIANDLMCWINNSKTSSAQTIYKNTSNVVQVLYNKDINTFVAVSRNKSSENGINYVQIDADWDEVVTKLTKLYGEKYIVSWTSKFLDSITGYITNVFLYDTPEEDIVVLLTDIWKGSTDTTAVTMVALSSGNWICDTVHMTFSKQ